ncbi:MAG: Hsp20/alpha crystallin family protein [Woeseiaceae bacterium]
MHMVRYKPWRSTELQNEINQLFNNWTDTDSNAATASWAPEVDIQEFENRFQLFVDLPGVEPREVEVTLDNDVLTISGERNFPPLKEGEQAINRRAERGHGTFYRRFILPETVDADNVVAKGQNGVLEISIPKQAKAQPRRIEVAA